MTPTRPDEQTALLDAIFARPNDDTPRLVYADCLEENGDGARAEFIRVLCELAHLLVDGKCPRCKDYGGPCDTCEFSRIEELRRRESALIAAHEAEWRCPEICSKCGGEGKFYVHSEADRIAYIKRTGKHPPHEITFAQKNCPTCHGLGRVGVLGDKIVYPSQPHETYESNDEYPVNTPEPIRVDWVRGFARVSCPVAWWCESKYVSCNTCNNTGRVGPPKRGASSCPACGISGVVTDYPNARRVWEEQGYCEVRFTDAVIHPSGGNDTYYVGFLVQFPREYWSKLQNLPSRAAAVAALSRTAQLMARGLATGTSF